MPFEITGGKFIFQRPTTSKSFRINGLYSYLKDHIQQFSQYDIRFNEVKKRSFLHFNDLNYPTIGAIRPHLSIDYRFLAGCNFLTPCHATIPYINNHGAVVTVRVYFDANAVAIYISAKIMNGASEIPYDLNDLEMHTVLKKIEHPQSILSKIYLLRNECCKDLERELLIQGHPTNNFTNTFINQVSKSTELLYREPTQRNQEYALTLQKQYKEMLQQYQRYLDRKNVEIKNSREKFIEGTIAWIENFNLPEPAPEAVSSIISSFSIDRPTLSIAFPPSLQKKTKNRKNAAVNNTIDVSINNIEKLLETDCNQLNYNALAEAILILECDRATCVTDQLKVIDLLLTKANEILRNKPVSLTISSEVIVARIETLTKKNKDIISKSLSNTFSKKMSHSSNALSAVESGFSADTMEQDIQMLEHDLVTLRTLDFQKNSRSNKKNNKQLNNLLENAVQTLMEMKAGMESVFQSSMNNFNQALAEGNLERARQAHAYLSVRHDLSFQFDQLLYLIDGYMDSTEKENQTLYANLIAVADYFYENCSTYRNVLFQRTHYMRPTNISNCNVGALVFAVMHNNLIAFEMYLRQGILPDVAQYRDEKNNIILNTLQYIALYSNSPQSEKFAQLLFQYGARLETDSLLLYPVKKLAPAMLNVEIKTIFVNSSLSVLHSLAVTTNYALLAVILRHCADSYDCSVETLLSVIQMLMSNNFPKTEQFVELAQRLQQKFKTMHAALTNEQKKALIEKYHMIKNNASKTSSSLSNNLLIIEAQRSIRILENLSELDLYMQQILTDDPSAMVSSAPIASIEQTIKLAGLGSEFFKKDNDFGKQLRNAANKQEFNKLQDLLNKHPDFVNEAGPTTGKTALHYAVSHKNKSCIQILLEKKADPDIADYERITARDLARNSDNDGILELLNTCVTKIVAKTFSSE